MKNITILCISFLALSLFLTGTAFAHETDTPHEEPEASVEAVIEAETVTSADLEGGDPTLLPTNPFYFMKEIGRGLQRALTFGGVAKTRLELKVASEKAAEAKKVAEQEPSNERGISRALANYERAQERLRVRLEQLRQTSQNPNVDRLLDQVTERIIIHEKLLEGLEAKQETQEENVERIREKVERTLGEVAKKDTVEKFTGRLEQALERGKGSTLKHLRSLELIDRLKENTEISEQVGERLDELRTKLSERTAESIERFAEEGEGGVKKLREVFPQLPGNALKRTVILEEIRARASERTADVLEEAQKELEETAGEAKDFEREARAQIERTEERIQKIEERVKEFGDQTPQAVRSLLDNAKEKAQEAKEAFKQGNPRNAFGLSRAAEAIVNNILRMLEKGVDTLRETPEILDRIRDRIRDRIEAVPLPKRRPAPTPSSGGESDREQVVCTMEYTPVCGVDGKTYSNRCIAEQQRRVRVAYEGECESSSSSRPCPLVDLEGCKAEGGELVATGVYDPHCGSIVQCVVPKRPTPGEQATPPPSPVSVVPVVKNIALNADDSGFYPSSEIRVQRGTKVVLTFNVSERNVYYGGLDFRSAKFNTSRVGPGDSTTVEFVADEAFEFKSYWPASNILKATGRVILE